MDPVIVPTRSADALPTRVRLSDLRGARRGGPATAGAWAGRFLVGVG